MTLSDAEKCTHPGPCDSDVSEAMQLPYIAKQLKKLGKEQLKKELRDYGAWDDTELDNHEENLSRWVWICAGSIVDDSINVD